MPRPLEPCVERAIVRDYCATDNGVSRFSTVAIARRNKVSQWTVNLVRLRHGLWRNESNAEPRTPQLRKAIAGSPPRRLVSGRVHALFACPECGLRAAEREGHPVCKRSVA